MRILLVCTGNICRSAMGERILQHAIQKRGLDIVVESAGISDEEFGNPIDPRAVQILDHRGYRSVDHSARQVTADMIMNADLILAMTERHAKALRQLAKDAGMSKAERKNRIRLYREFATTVPEDGNLDISDPWYGDMEDFIETLTHLEDGIEGVLNHFNTNNMGTAEKSSS